MHQTIQYVDQVIWSSQHAKSSRRACASNVAQRIDDETNDTNSKYIDELLGRIDDIGASSDGGRTGI